MLALLLPAVMATAQKKPNINKALNLMQSGELAEAKEIIDAATTYEKTRDDGKTWYYRALIYATIDTTQNTTVWADHALETAMASLKVADSLNDGKHEYFITNAQGALEMRSQQFPFLEGYFINNGATAYQDDGDTDTAIEDFRKATVVNPEDTLGYYYKGLVENEAGEFDKALKSMDQYLARGGASIDAYRIMFNIYANEKEDQEKALELARRAEKVFPYDLDFPKYEISMLLQLNRTEEAKNGLVEAIEADPMNQLLYLFLGYTHEQLGEKDEAIKAYEKALSVKPDYGDAQLYLSRLVSEKAHGIRREMNNLGISKADMKKKQELDKQYVEELNRILPYWEKARKLLPKEGEILDELQGIYSDLGMDDKANEVQNTIEQLGLNKG